MTVADIIFLIIAVGCFAVVTVKLVNHFFTDFGDE